MLVNGHPIEYFYETEVDERLNDQEFRLGNYIQRFSLRNTAQAPNPDELLLAIFAHLISIAAEAGGDRLSCIIRSPSLVMPIQIPYRPFAQNTPQVILNEFKARQESVRPINLLDGPLYVEIVTGPLPRAKAGARGPNKKLFRRDVPVDALVWVDNTYDNYCLFRALELTRLHQTASNAEEKRKINDLINGGTVFYELKRLKLVTELLDRINRMPDFPKIRRGLKEYSIEEHLPIVEEFYRRYYADKPEGVPRIAVFNEFASFEPLYKGQQRGSYDLCLYLEKAEEEGVYHFHGIRNVNAFFQVKRYCIDCESSYERPKKHAVTCKAKCTKCCGIGPGFPCGRDVDFSFLCPDCNKRFYSRACLMKHQMDKVCELYKCCAHCGITYNTKRKPGHICGHRFCKLCRSVHDVAELCVVQKPEERAHREKRIVCYDFETSQDRHFIGGGRLHEVNFIGAHLCCTKCITQGKWDEVDTGECRICGAGEERKCSWSAARFSNPLREFMQWLFHLPARYETIAVAHYGGKYDMHFVLGEIYRRGGITPEITRKGEKLYEIRVRRRGDRIAKTSFRDSYNWMAIKLEELPKTLGLGVEDKGFFPHLYNKKDNFDVELGNLPAIEMYAPKRMMPEKAFKFYHWYYANAVAKRSPFCLKEALEEYCMQDVAILMHAVVKLRRLFLEVTTKDIVSESLTIAGFCQDYFIEKYMKAGDIAIIPDGGYAKKDKQSAKALLFLKWLAFNEGLRIQHRDSAQGEVRVKQGHRLYKLDGYVKRQAPERDLCIEFHGCSIHGHHCLYTDEDALLWTGLTVGLQREKDAKKRAVIERLMDYECYWECEVDEMLRKNPEMRKFYDAQRDSGPLDPRDAYFGGRTGPFSLKCDLNENAEMKEKMTIRNLDIVSLYPYINYDSEYPVGHGKPVDMNHRVMWTQPEHNPYKGLIKCFIVPPSNLMLPVVPKIYNGKLMFPLCHACTLNSEAKWRQLGKPARDTATAVLCPHRDADRRGFTTTLTHMELNKALEKGYEVHWLYSAIVWSKWSRDLFKGYVQDFMKIKTEAGGWPQAVGDDPVKRQEFIGSYRARFGVKLDPDNMVKNPGLKYIAKICLNSMWGRWSLRNDQGMDLITNRPEKLWQTLNDSTLDIGAIQRLAPRLYMASYHKKKDFVKSHAKYNVVLSLFTSSAARLHLYHFMEMVDNDVDSRLLYIDTDSVFVLCPKDKCPVPCGDMLGDMSDQYPNHNIPGYYGLGCKFYALTMEDKESGHQEEVIKAKGITLDDTTTKRLNYALFKEMVKNFGTDISLKLKMNQFRPNAKSGHVVTQTLVKTFRGIYDKGMVDAELNCYPFGFTGPFRPNLL